MQPESMIARMVKKEVKKKVRKFKGYSDSDTDDDEYDGSLVSRGFHFLFSPTPSKICIYYYYYDSFISIIYLIRHLQFY